MNGGDVESAHVLVVVVEVRAVWEGTCGFVRSFFRDFATALAAPAVLPVARSARVHPFLQDASCGRETTPSAIRHQRHGVCREATYVSIPRAWRGLDVGERGDSVLTGCCPCRAGLREQRRS